MVVACERGKGGTVQLELPLDLSPLPQKKAVDTLW